MSRLIPLLFAFVLLGCVQVDDRPVLPKPAPRPSTPIGPIDNPFRDADETIVAQILADPALLDANRLRKYAAMYAGVADVIEKQTNDTVFRLTQAGIKATRDYMGPASQTLGSAFASRLNPDQVGEEDRGKVVSVFRLMSASCHKAAHMLETR